MKFPTWCHGFTAYLDHLALYLGIEGYPTNITLDPRHFPYLKGTAKYVEDLSGKWCPNQSYAANIIKYMNEIKNIHSYYDKKYYNYCFRLQYCKFSVIR